MAYEVLRSDGAVIATVADGTVDDTNTSLALIGKNFAGYGILQNENFVRLLENFSNTIEPNQPMVGQLWYDKSNKLLKYRHVDNTWKVVASSTVSTAAPFNPNVGDYWWNTLDEQFNVYNGQEWILIGPAFKRSQGLTGAFPEIIRDTNSASHVVIKFYINDTVTGIWCKDLEDFTVHPDDKVVGFYQGNDSQVVRPGLTLADLGNHSTSGYSGIDRNTIWGTAENALMLNNRKPSDYLRTDSGIAAQEVQGEVEFSNKIIFGSNVFASFDSIQDIGTSQVRFGNIYARQIYGNINGIVSQVANIGNHNTDNLPEGNLNLYWNTTRATANKKYIDDSDYLNFDPLAGVLTENYAPLYSDFKFSLQLSSGSNTPSSVSYLLTDNQNFEVMYFHATTPTGVYRPFRAYRFAPTDQFTYDSEPLSVLFAAPGETVRALLNIGTDFAYLQMSPVAPAVVGRRLLAKTNGSSKSVTWTLFADVTNITNSGSTNLFLMTDPNGDRILKVTTQNDLIKLEIYNQSLTLLRSLNLFSDSEVSNLDHTASGRQIPTTGGYSVPGLVFGYFPLNASNPFTWNKFTENLLIKLTGWQVYNNNLGNSIGQGFSATISWNIPRTWFANGTGTPVNLISVKTNSGKRYHRLKDSTWDTEFGGMGEGFGKDGTATAVVTDEYAKKVRVTNTGTWESTGFSVYTFNNVIIRTIGSYLQPLKSETVGIPDASPWSKKLWGSYGQIIGNNILFWGQSNKFGGNAIAANFSLTQFNSSTTDPANANDTLKLNPITYKFDGNLSSGVVGIRKIGTTVVSGTPINYMVSPGEELKIITVVNGERVYTGSGFTLPALPTTLASYNNVSVAGPTVYNGDPTSRKFWTIVKSGSTESYQFFIAEYSNNAWFTLHGPFAQTAIETGQNNRQDTLDQWYIDRGNPCLTENGRFIQQFAIPVVGGATWYYSEFDVNTKIHTVHPEAKFAQSGPYGISSGYYGQSFGYSTNFGYYIIQGMSNQAALAITSSKDPRGVGTELNENQWWNGGTGIVRHISYISAESAAGLFVYLKEYPLFIGGYYTKLPEATIDVPPNATSYIYAVKSVDNRANIEIQVSSDYQPTSFNKVNLARIVTGENTVISSTVYRIRSTDTSAEVDSKINAAITSLGGDISALASVAVSGSYTDLTDKPTTVLPVGSIIMWSGAVGTIPAGWQLCNGQNGTPDLRNRFIVGAGSTYNVGGTGGSANAYLVTHSHPIVDPGHVHSTVQMIGDDNVDGVDSTALYSGDHHNEARNTGSATTGISVGLTGNGDGVGANLPPYYALCYIMYTAT